MIREKKISYNNLLLLLVIAVAAVLRFWNFSGMKYMHDELSALIRAQAGSFSELIHKAKTTDVHPVGIPIFVHYWSALFGKSEIVIRLPFILCGLISIYYSYKVAEKWFNPTVAIITCAFLASLQFTTMYGQLERPYATGMLFSVQMVWCWTAYFFGDPTKQTKSLIGFVITASLCTYDHYFSLLFAATVCGTGLLFVNKQSIIKYLCACFAILILFVPHLSILFYHLSNGSGEGDSWLGKPQPDWLIMFLKYLFHYSKLVYLLVAILFAGSIYYYNPEIRKVNKMRIIAIVWALFVPTLAYVYSISKTPVLQFSTFTFSIPFLLMFIFSFYRELKTPIKSVIVVIIILVNTATLFATRKHYSLFYKQPYEEMARMSVETINEQGEKNVTITLSAMEGFVDFYFEKYRKPFTYLRVDKPETKAFLSYLENQKTDYFVAGNLPLEYYQLIKKHYPYLIKMEEGFTYSVYCFSKIKPEKEIKEKVVFSENQNDAYSANHKQGHWENVKNMSEDPVYPGTFYMRLDSTEEYSPGFSAKLCEIIKSKHSILNVSADIFVDDETSNPTLVVSIDDEGKSLLWRGSEYQEYKTKGKEFNQVCVSNLFSGMDLGEHPNATIKIYIWNRNKKSALVHNFKVEVIESNPVIYGLYEPIE